jgi:hypothetical protein
MKTSNDWVKFLLAVLILTIVAAVNAQQPQRFFPEALQQDGKITLSPGFSPDGKTIYFAQSECTPIWECPQRLKTAQLTADGWSTPELVQLPVDARTDWPAVTPDGNTLVFSWSAPREDYQNLDVIENFDLYTLDLTKSGSVPVPIYGADINRPRAGEIKSRRYFHNESYSSVTAAGDLYFMTERIDGFGERDIYVAKAGDDGRYQTAVPLPEPINSKQRDDGVWVDSSGTVMLLTYPNRGGQGGADLFISILRNGEWIEPRNLGPQINSPFADFAGRLTPDKKSLVFTSDRPFPSQEEGLLQVWVADLPEGILRLIKSPL